MDFLIGYTVFDWVSTWANPYTDVFFRAVTDLGSPIIYCIVIAPLFWIVDRQRATILLLLVLASAYLNSIAKLCVNWPRPDPNLARVLDLRPLQTGSNGFPSGHAQGALIVWTYLAGWVGRRWFSALAAVMVALISFSRLYLAVHFPIDVVGGIALGVAVMLTLPALFRRWSESGFPLSPALAVCVFIGSLLLALYGGDLTLALIGGSVMGFLIGAIWLPQLPLVFANRQQMTLALTGGLSLLIVLSGLLDAIPRQPLPVYTAVTLSWLVALWLYPQALHRLWLQRSTAPERSV